MTITATYEAAAADEDEALDDIARGVAPTSDEPEDENDDEAVTAEIDAIGAAAGVAVRDGVPLGGPDAIERRDAHRWELDPASAEVTADGVSTR